MRGLLLLICQNSVSAALLYLALRGINFGALQSRREPDQPLWIGLAVSVSISGLPAPSLARSLGALPCALTDLQAFATT